MAIAISIAMTKANEALVESIKRIKHTIEAGATRIRLKEEECCKLTARAKVLSKKWYALNEVVADKLKEKPQLRCQT